MSAGARVLVCGGRDYSNRDELYGTLDALANIIRVAVVIEGEAAGADTLAASWAFSKGLPIARYPAQWRTDGKAAGVRRNRRMLDQAKPDLVIAFPMPESRGTWHMVQIAREAGVPVWVMPQDRARIDAVGEGVFV